MHSTSHTAWCSSILSENKGLEDSKQDVYRPLVVQVNRHLSSSAWSSAVCLDIHGCSCSSQSESPCVSGQALLCMTAAWRLTKPCVVSWCLMPQQRPQIVFALSCVFVKYYAQSCYILLIKNGLFVICSFSLLKWACTHRSFNILLSPLLPSCGLGGWCRLLTTQ